MVPLPGRKGPLITPSARGAGMVGNLTRKCDTGGEHRVGDRHGVVTVSCEGGAMQIAGDASGMSARSYNCIACGAPMHRNVMYCSQDCAHGRGLLLPGGPYTPVQVLLWPLRAALFALVLVSGAYLAICGLETAEAYVLGHHQVFELMFGQGQLPADASERVGDLADMRQRVGHLLGLDGDPQPVEAAMFGFVGWLFGSPLGRFGRRRFVESGRYSTVDGASGDGMDDEIQRAVKKAVKKARKHDVEWLKDELRAAGVKEHQLSESVESFERRAGRGGARKRRIAGVHAAIEQLDAEWLSYTLDLAEYYLTKPVLRDDSVAQTAAYRAALYELRERAEGLGEHPSDKRLGKAERAAEAALLAWGEANDHALAVGVSDRSLTERIALRRLHKLVTQLCDPGTPRDSRQGLVEAISREMDKLVTVPTSWRHLSSLPALEGLALVGLPAAPIRSGVAAAVSNALVQQDDSVRPEHREHA